MTIDTSPPNAIEAENALLGSMLIDPAAYWDVAGFLKADDLYLVKNRWIFEAIATLQGKRQPADIVTIAAEMDKQNRKPEGGVFLSLSQLTEGVPSAIHAETYGREVEAAAVRRRMFLAASEIAKLAYQSNRPVDNVIEDAEQAIFNISDGRSFGDLVHIREATSAFYDRTLQLKEDGAGALGPLTGLVDLDSILGGLGRDDVTLLAGRPSMGKTAMLLQVAKNIALDYAGPGSVAVFSLEMSKQQLVGRLVSSHARIDGNRLRRGQVRDDELAAFTAAVAWASELALYIDDTAGITPSQLRSRCRRLYAEKGGIKAVLIDYIGLMTTTRRYDKRNNEMGYISSQLKGLARDLQVPLLVAAQLNRMCETRGDKHPAMSDLRDSGDLEQDADTILLLFRDDYYNKETSLKPNVVEVEVAKARNGPVGMVEFYFDKACTTFRPLERRRA